MSELLHHPGARGQGTKGRRRAGTLLDAALSVLVDDGSAALSLRRVATHAGVRLSHLQYYYRSKSELLQALTTRELERRASIIESMVATTGTKPADGLPSLLGAMLEEQQDRDAILLFAELRALANRDPTIEDLMRGYTRRYWRAIVRAMTMANPTIRRPQAERRAALLVALLEGLMLFRSPDRPRELPLLGLDRELDELVALLIDR